MDDNSAPGPELSGTDSDAGLEAKDPKKNNAKLATNDHSGVFRAINSILTSKRPSQHVNPILSKRRKLVQKEAAESEIRDAKARIAANNKVLERRRKQNKDIAKPDVSMAAHEHALRKIATRGVLRLFNAIAKHQNKSEGDVDESMSQKAQKEEAKKKKSESRDMFLKLLRGHEADLSHALTGTVPKAADKVEGQVEGEDEDEDEDEGEPAAEQTAKEPKWRVLQDDLLLGPSKLKDWDVASESSEDDEKALRLKRKQAATTSVVPKEEGGLWDGLSGSDDSEEQED